MGHYLDTTVEIELNGEKVRVAKHEVDLYQKSKKKSTKEDKPTKD